MDKAVVGSARVGYFRVGIQNDKWETLRKQWGNCEVTKYRLQLDSPPNATTGWYTRTLIQENAVTVSTERLGPNMIIYDRSMQTQALAAGTYVKDDAVGVTADPFLEGDEVLTKQGQVFEVKTVTPHYGPDNDFHYYTYDLTLLPFRFVAGSSYTASTVQDARYRTKVYLDTYLNSAYLGNFLVCYAEPDYPLTRVFKEKGKDVIFAIKKPVSKVVKNADKTTDSYDEQVPIQVLAIDKEDVNGSVLQANAEMHLLETLDTYIFGSVREIAETRDVTRNLGSTKIYGSEVKLNYLRQNA